MKVAQDPSLTVEQRIRACSEMVTALDLGTIATKMCDSYTAGLERGAR
jgi:hypothetical protein